MEKMTSEELFIETVNRVNRYLIMLGIFFLGYFFLNKEANIFLFLLALSNMAFALLSYKHLQITNRMIVECMRAKIALQDSTKPMREMHPDYKGLKR